MVTSPIMHADEAMGRDAGVGHEARLLGMLEGLLALETATLDAAMRRAAEDLASVLGADKADVFLHHVEGDALVAIGTSDTPMGRHQRALGLDRLPLAEGGRTVETFRTGATFLAHSLDLDARELPRVVAELGVRSVLAVPIEAAGERRGVLLAASAAPGFFTAEDRTFMGAVAAWVGLVGYRALYMEHVAALAAEAGVRVATERAVEILTARQREVAAHVADGFTNVQIARRLVLTPGTVANHVEHILRRLEFGSRVQVATWVRAHGLTVEASVPDE